MPDQTDPKDLPAENSKSGAGHIDLGKVLLPKKEVPGQTPLSAERINAGVLLEQEQTAAKEGAPAAAEAPDAPVPLKPKNTATVKPIETYQSDIEQLVQDKNVSVLQIAAAEAERRARTGGSAAQTPVVKETFSEKLEKFKQLWKKVAMVIAGVLLLCAAAGGLAYVFLRPTSTPPVQAPSSPFIAVDDTKVITVDPTDSRSDIMAQLTSAQASVNLSLGLIDRLLPAVASTTPNGGQTLVAMDAQTFLSILAPDIPPQLLRTINPTFLLGVHVYDGNQALLIFNVDSYEDAYAGMLAWEPTMLNDLSPLFAYTPGPHINGTVSTSSVATTSNEFIQTGFIDDIVENHDARVLQNSTGDIYLLWTFLDRNTLVITTNDATLREIISRVEQAPVTPIPGQ